MEASDTIQSTTVSPWIRSARYDLSLVLGGAAVTLLVALFATAKPLWIPFFFWVWIIGFEGSHFWATWARTYFDRDYFSSNRGLLLFSILVFFTIPLGAALFSKITDNDALVVGYGFFIFIWSLFHNARQHYGFVSLYIRKSGNASPQTLERLRFGIYGAVIIPQIFFLVRYKFPITYLASEPRIPAFSWVTPFLCISLGAASIVLFYVLSLKRRLGIGRSQSLKMAWLYILGCWSFYSAMFFGITAIEPVFPLYQNKAQLFMVVTIMNSLFHNIQYHAIVWQYGNQRLIRKGEKVGLAGSIFRHPAFYVTASLGSGALFGWIVWKLGDWPSIAGQWSKTPFDPLAYALYFGIVGHHFYLDQKIWRPSRQKELRESLGLSPKAAVA